MSYEASAISFQIPSKQRVGIVFPRMRKTPGEIVQGFKKRWESVKMENNDYKRHLEKLEARGLNSRDTKKLDPVLEIEKEIKLVKNIYGTGMNTTSTCFKNSNITLEKKLEEVEGSGKLNIEIYGNQTKKFEQAERIKYYSVLEKLEKLEKLIGLVSTHNPPVYLLVSLRTY